MDPWTAELRRLDERIAETPDPEWKATLMRLRSTLARAAATRQVLVVPPPSPN